MDGVGWFHSQMMHVTNLEGIITDDKDVTTSIPTPFARYDLVRHALGSITDRFKSHDKLF